MTKQSTGREGEEAAALYLMSQGYTIIDRNVKQYGVEADILAKQGRTWVIVEVKTKHALDFGLPQEMVGPRKQGQLRRFARGLLADHGEIPVRVDVIAVRLDQEPPHLEHLQSVVEEI